MAVDEAKYKLTYFDMAGRGEAIRVCLVLAEEDFTDERLGLGSEEWTKLKPETAWGSLPTLQLLKDDDKMVISQTPNILRYLGRMTGYYPFHDQKRACRVDEILDAWNDILSGLFNSANNAENTEELRTAYITEGSGKALLAKLDAFIDNSSEGRYAVGNQLSIADMVTWSYANWLSSGTLKIPEDCMSSYNNINRIRFNLAGKKELARYLHKNFGEGQKFNVYATIDVSGTMAQEPGAQVEEEVVAETEEVVAETEANEDEKVVEEVEGTN